MKKIVIQPRGGLCNRLRFIFSFIKKLKDENEYNNTLIFVVWRVDSSCNDYFLNYFKPMNNIVFLNNNLNELNIYKCGCKVFSKYKSSNYLILKKLKLKEEIYNKIYNTIKDLENNYISCHIRRTDLNYFLEKNNKKDKIYQDEDYVKFIKKNRGYHVYIATDNLKTQQYFSKNIKRTKFYEKIEKDKRGLRKTSLEHAVVDLFVCALSYEFMGSYFSSYTDFIKIIRINLDKDKSPIQNLKLFK